MRPQPFLTSHSKLAMDEHSDVHDVVVVGAGVQGSFTAYHLVHSGVKKVLLLEQVGELLKY